LGSKGEQVEKGSMGGVYQGLGRGEAKHP